MSVILWLKMAVPFSENQTQSGLRAVADQCMNARMHVARAPSVLVASFSGAAR